MRARQKDIRRQVEYPESDGKPVGETDKHILLLFAFRFMLDEFFRATERVYVGSNLMCYYVEGDPTKSISPDVFVVRGAEKGQRRIYKFWEEPAPQFVLEISSRKTRKEDFGKKKDIYEWLGVREYFVYDPEAKLRAPLRAFRLQGAKLIEEMVTSNRVMSQELGLELVNTGETLRLYNPRTKEFLLTPTETYARAAEEAARANEEAARAARLAAKLRELGVDPDQL
ncbi:MAG TPA: Uma2 family endonuclease [Blastocatellia bacterium]|nr:Uma2 family endonuclease [Blastocatellia bacterium]